MPNELIGVKCQLGAFALVRVLLVTIALSQAVSAADVPAGCVTDQPLQVCVVSAAVTQAQWHGERKDQRGLTVSVTLKATNTSDFPVDLALVGGKWGSWSLTPQNAEAIMNQGDWNVSGLQVCRQLDQCTMTTISPAMSLLVQIQYRGVVSTAGFPLIEIASTAAFTGSMVVVERGAPRLVSFALDGFTFGNAIGKSGP